MLACECAIVWACAHTVPISAMKGVREFEKLENTGYYFPHSLTAPIHHRISHNYIIGVLLNKQPCIYFKIRKHFWDQYLLLRNKPLRD